MTKVRAKKKNIQPEKKGTLDQRHTEKIVQLEKMAQILPIKKHKLVKLQNELNELNSMNPNKFSHEDIHRKSCLIDMINNLKNEIDEIENCRESLNYIVKTLPILINYYDNDHLIDDGIEEEFINDVNDSGKKNILSYFANETNKTTKKIESKPKKLHGSKTAKPLKQSQLKQPPLTRAKLYDNYLSATDSNHRMIRKRNDKCSMTDCNGEKILSQNDGFMVCNKCGLSEMILMTTDKPSYKEPTQDSGSYAYKRINHLTEILSQLQAKESTDISPKVFEYILRELKKRKIDKNDLDIFRLRRILKKLNYRKYYEHVSYFTDN